MARRPLLALISAGRHVPGSPALVELAAAAGAAGIDFVQIRERQLDDRALLDLVERVVAALRGNPTRVLVNGRVDIALAGRAGGVHLPGSGLEASRIRAITPPGFVIGRSVHALDEARQVEASGGCDYLMFGTVFPSGSKPAGHPVAGVTLLAEVCAAIRLPVIAIGGMSLNRVASVAAAGAAGLAAIGLFDSANPGPAAAAARKLFDT